jgi:hypothetical protein
MSPVLRDILIFEPSSEFAKHNRAYFGDTILPSQKQIMAWKPTPQTAKRRELAARFQRGKPPRNSRHLSVSHISLTFVVSASPFACDLAPFPSSHRSLATHCQQKSEQAGS